MGEILGMRSATSGIKKKDNNYLLTEDKRVSSEEEKTQVQITFWLIKGISEEKTVKEDTYENIEKIHRKEIHHRIKNNLQVISSLLSLQASCFEDSEVLEAFRKTQNRVTSMALIHEELYESDNQEKLDFTAYLRKLTKELFIFYKAGSSRIKLQMDFKEEIFLDMDIAIPLGMIVNELVTNSLKHAFPSGSGEIKIEFYRIKANKIAKKSVNSGNLKNSKFILIISDNGSGFPKSINFENPGTLGLQLVKTLIEQINGKIRFKGYPATKIEIEFATSIL